MLRINIRTNPTRIPSEMAITRTTQTAKRAVFGLPAPSSFETRVLHCKTGKDIGVYLMRRNTNW